MNGGMALLMFATVFIILLAGYPVAFSLAGTALGFALVGQWLGAFDFAVWQHCRIACLAS